ncbi:MAG: serine hydrolase [Vicinamibacterales bacterium]
MRRRNPFTKGPYGNIGLPGSREISGQRLAAGGGTMKVVVVVVVSLAVMLQTRAPEMTFPGTEWERAASLEALGWSSEKVAALEETVKATGTHGFMIVTRGKVIASWADVDRTFLTHSIRKSFMSALYGIAVGEKKIDVERTIGSLGITEKGVTLTPVELRARLIDLLKARSGVYLKAAGEIDSMISERPKRGSHAPDTFWYYNNWDFNVLGSVFRKLTGEDIFEAIDRRIAKPIGMQDYRAADGEYYFAAASEHAGYIFRISARDLARFGHLYLNRGRWRDTQVIPASWVDASVRSYSTVAGAQRSLATRTGYGYLWWIQTSAKEHPELRIPDGTFTASGTGGQRLTVIPQIDTVIVNLMNTDDERADRLGSDQWDAILAAVLAARLDQRPGGRRKMQTR